MNGTESLELIASLRHAATLHDGRAQSHFVRVMDTPAWDGRQAPRRLANAAPVAPVAKVKRDCRLCEN